MGVLLVLLVVVLVITGVVLVPTYVYCHNTVSVMLTLSKVKQWLGIEGGEERENLTATELLPTQDYKMAQSFSGEDIHDVKVCVYIPYNTANPS